MIHPDRRYMLRISIFLAICLYFLNSWPAAADQLENLGSFIGSKDAIVVTGPKGDILYSKNASKKLIPASVLKILTALVALHYLGPDYKFATDFYLDPQSNLKVKGYGDPLLISEVISDIAKKLALKLDAVDDLVMDDSYFDQPLTIPGITASTEPYDAPNGALCANFNTVNFRRIEDGKYISAEPQTPLLPFAAKRIRHSKMYQGRIVFSHKEKEAALYAGHLIAYFLNAEGVQHSGNIKTGTVRKSHDTLVHTYVSPYTLTQLITQLLEYSNNFTANQLFISAGAEAYGAPGSLEKGIRAARSYAQYELNIENLDIVEGSGISRDNRISANNMMKILLKFKPYHYLLRYEEGEYYKTGTLKGIRTRAGYIESENGELCPFVVLINTPGKVPHGIMKRLRRMLKN